MLLQERHFSQCPVSRTASSNAACSLSSADTLFRTTTEIFRDDCRRSDIPCLPLTGLTAGNPSRLDLWVWPFTDLGNARRLVRAFGADIRFLAAAQAWLVWDGRR